MDKLELVELLQKVSGFDWRQVEWFCGLPYGVTLLDAAKGLSEEDFEKGPHPDFPNEVSHFPLGIFCGILARFIEANVETYTTPKSTLTGTESA